MIKTTVNTSTITCLEKYLYIKYLSSIFLYNKYTTRPREIKRLRFQTISKLIGSDNKVEKDHSPKLYIHVLNIGFSVDKTL